MSDRASKALAEASLPGEPRTYNPPMTLREHEILNATQLGFLIPPLPSIFRVSATQVLTKTVCPLESLQILTNWVSSCLMALINLLVGSFNIEYLKVWRSTVSRSYAIPLDNEDEWG
jgi:hypothetical protein